MSDPARFLTSFAQALAAMTLYRDGHPARGRAVDAAYQELHDLQADTARPLFTFLGDEVVYGRLPLRDLKEWDWGRRLAEAGGQRVQCEEPAVPHELHGMLAQVPVRGHLLVILPVQTGPTWRMSIPDSRPW